MAGTKSTHVHIERTPVRRSRRARSKTFSRKSALVSQKAILTVIALAMMIVVLALITINFTKPERIVARKIESIAADYYENYFYDQILNSVDGAAMSDVLERYTRPGFTAVSLRTLMLFDGQRHADAAAVLYEYCDPDETTVKFYPVSPYGPRDYTVNYKYACIF